MSPDESLRFAIGRGSAWLGLVLVAWSDTGLCAILPGEEVPALRADLARRFGGWACLPASADARIDRVLAFLEAPAGVLDWPLDPRGTPFQLAVWDALRRVPAGTTTTYGNLAGLLGMPSAARAVARACAANPLAGAIPCHRVIGRDGSLTGYRWGLERKAMLLARESRVNPG